jgi:hypothetical protein
MLPFFLLQQTCTSRLVGGLVLRIFIDRNFRNFAETGAKGYYRFFPYRRNLQLLWNFGWIYKSVWKLSTGISGSKNWNTGAYLYFYPTKKKSFDCDPVLVPLDATKPLFFLTKFSDLVNRVTLPNAQRSFSSNGRPIIFWLSFTCCT